MPFSANVCVGIACRGLQHLIVRVASCVFRIRYDKAAGKIFRSSSWATSVEPAIAYFTSPAFPSQPQKQPQCGISSLLAPDFSIFL